MTYRNRNRNRQQQRARDRQLAVDRRHRDLEADPVSLSDDDLTAALYRLGQGHVYAGHPERSAALRAEKQRRRDTAAG